MSRRELLAAVAGAPFLLKGPKSTDITVEDVRAEFEEYFYRTAYMFGGRSVDRVTLCNVHCRVRTVSGRTASGFGSMPLGNQWSFPSNVMDTATTLGAMKVLAQRIEKITGDYKGASHPIDINWALEPAYLGAAEEVSKHLGLIHPIPKLCTLVTASPFDAALHDAYGKAHGRNAFLACSPELMNHDLGHYLGADFRGEVLSRYVQKKPAPRMRLFHSVGASDPLLPSDVRRPIGDGLPEHLAQWIDYNGLRALKIKLNGSDLAGDLERTLTIDRIATETQAKRDVREWSYCLDFNEGCPNVASLIEYLRRLKERAPAAFGRILYIEQPTKRDLRADRGNLMHEAAKLRPVVIDESLTDYETLMLAREMGYTGAALKACKGQTQALLMSAAGQKHRLFLCVQDLTCPGAALIHSASLASRVPGVSGIEANARQYVPAANKVWEDRYPGLFRIRDGTLDTATLTRPGLGAVE